MIASVVAGGFAYWVGQAVDPARRALFDRLMMSPSFRRRAVEASEYMQTKFPRLPMCNGEEAGAETTMLVASSVVQMSGWFLTSGSIVVAVIANENSEQAQTIATLVDDVKAIQDGVNTLNSNMKVLKNSVHGGKVEDPFKVLRRRVGLPRGVPGYPKVYK